MKVLKGQQIEKGYLHILSEIYGKWTVETNYTIKTPNKKPLSKEWSFTIIYHQTYSQRCCRISLGDQNRKTEA